MNITGLPQYGDRVWWRDSTHAIHRGTVIGVSYGWVEWRGDARSEGRFLTSVTSWEYDVAAGQAGYSLGACDVAKIAVLSALHSALAAGDPGITHALGRSAIDIERALARYRQMAASAPGT
jgi:hypothetical protein